MVEVNQVLNQMTLPLPMGEGNKFSVITFLKFQEYQSILRTR